MSASPMLDIINNQRNSNNQQNQSNQQLQQYKNLLKQIQSSKNPQQALQSMILNNPQTRGALDFIRLSNGNLQQAAEYIARQKGVNLNTLINELQN